MPTTSPTVLIEIYFSQDTDTADPLALGSLAWVFGFLLSYDHNAADDAFCQLNSGHCASICVLPPVTVSQRLKLRLMRSFCATRVAASQGSSTMCRQELRDTLLRLTTPHYNRSSRCSSLTTLKGRKFSDANFYYASNTPWPINQPRQSAKETLVSRIPSEESLCPIGFNPSKTCWKGQARNGLLIE